MIFNKEICNNCLVVSTCETVCEKVIKQSRKTWDIIKETKGCPDCGHTLGIIYEVLGRDPSFSMYCQKCKHGFGFDFSNQLVENYQFDGNDDIYAGLDIEKYEQTFKEIVQNISRLGIS